MFFLSSFSFPIPLYKTPATAIMPILIPLLFHPAFPKDPTALPLYKLGNILLVLLFHPNSHVTSMRRREKKRRREEWKKKRTVEEEVKNGGRRREGRAVYIPVGSLPRGCGDGLSKEGNCDGVLRRMSVCADWAIRGKWMGCGRWHEKE
ncbi:hypothetical protein GQ43DRAFT_311803 [Delitschia confertaspora ATCC 74209]|uniref:Uncharacterized protein n=1 Tax=Delitschia confertaspora ATCC 74209 TaxID=1513339 RepID=A0A9P4JNP1_9PLEO|nr:hypothetical protein GQ43DRAFT_311803 [Delitschia confertaspora ATCC 74209]